MKVLLAENEICRSIFILGLIMIYELVRWHLAMISRVFKIAEMTCIGKSITISGGGKSTAIDYRDPLALDSLMYEVFSIHVAKLAIF